MDRAAITEANRRAWDASAPHHGAGAEWDRLVAGFATPGFSVLDATATGALRAAGIVGASVVQIGCNNGREVLSCLALGAEKGPGIDQSAAFLAQARALQAVSGGPAEFLEADIYALPPDVPRGWDIGLITIGVLNWMPDLPRFFEAVAGLLAPGGRLVIYETHPVLEMFDPASETPFEPTISYFAEAPFVQTGALVYDGSDAGEAAPSYWFVHPLGRILTACAGAGFVIESVEEFGHSNREIAYDVYAGRLAQVPMCWTLRARRV